jgi:hypothetical protein
MIPPLDFARVFIVVTIYSWIAIGWELKRLLKNLNKIMWQQRNSTPNHLINQTH